MKQCYHANGKDRIDQHDENKILCVYELGSGSVEVDQYDINLRRAKIIDCFRYIQNYFSLNKPFKY